MGMRLKGLNLASQKRIRPGDRFFQVWLDMAYVHMEIDLIGRFHRDATSHIWESSTLRLRRANE